MSCQAGMWNFDGKPIDREFLGKLGASIVQYGPDQADEWGRGGPGEYIHDNVAMIYRPFHTNKESRLERQPYVTRCKDSGAVRNVMTWDGRLDNRFELMAMLGSDLAMNHPGERTDAAIVMAAWERWGTDCFKKLIGDFSLAVWDAKERTLTLAKDFIGVRYLYYEILPEGMRGGARTDPELGDAEPPSGPCVWWCSRLEPLILLSGRQYEINEEYIAGYFAFHPANHITPYVGVHALPAGHYVQIRAPHANGAELRVSRETAGGLKKWLAGRRENVGADFSPSTSSPRSGVSSLPRAAKGDPFFTSSLATDHPKPARRSQCEGGVTKVQYWHFDPDKRITYKTDAEYEEHFRQVFFQSVKRRLRADAPVVAGLSGGRDSSAIVCVADEIIAKGEVETPRLDTYSRYDEEEPFGNEKPYLTIVERKRGRTGHHITPVGSEPFVAYPSVRRLLALELDYFSSHPGIDKGGADTMGKRHEFMKLNGYRIILAGIGGDEVTGGVPYCISELADLLVSGRLVKLGRQLRAWGLAQNRTWTSLAWRTAKSLMPGSLCTLFWGKKDKLFWVDPNFIARLAEIFRRGHRVCDPCEGLPSFRTNVAVIAGISWQLARVAKLHQRGAKANCYERGFPFLDRDFLEFMVAIPRDQVLRARQYRSLMRRGLKGVVPDEVLNRTRKAFAARRPAIRIQAAIPEVRDLFGRSLSMRLGLIDTVQFLKEVDEIAVGKTSLIRSIQQTVILEMWLRSLAERGILRQISTPLAIASKGRVLEGVA